MLTLAINAFWSRVRRTTMTRARDISILLAPMNIEGIEVREAPTFDLGHLVNEVVLQDVYVTTWCRLGEDSDGSNSAHPVLADERAKNSRHSAGGGALDSLLGEAVDTGVALANDRVWENIERAARRKVARHVPHFVVAQDWNCDTSDHLNWSPSTVGRWQRWKSVRRAPSSKPSTPRRRLSTYHGMTSNCSTAHCPASRPGRSECRSTGWAGTSPDHRNAEP